MVGLDLSGGVSLASLEKTGILDGVDSSGHLDTLVAGRSGTCTVVKVGRSKTGFSSMVGLDLSGEVSLAGLENTGILDGVESSGHLDTLVAGRSGTYTVVKVNRSKLDLTPW